MNGMELNVNYSILFLYTCGLAYYSLSSSSLSLALSLSLSVSLSFSGLQVQVWGRWQIWEEKGEGEGGRRGWEMQLEIWVFVP